MVTHVRPTVAATIQSNVPAFLRGLVAANPKVAVYYAQDPGLRALLDANQANVVGDVSLSGSLPRVAGKVVDKVTWESWCHTTTIVPAAVRDEEYIIVVARGSAYANKNEIQLPLTTGKTATSEGKIIYVGKTKDYLNTQRPADENGHYPGAITVDLSFNVEGTAGEKVELAYCRVKPDDKGRLHPNFSGWPDSFKGVYGGYSGRELELTLAGGKKQFAASPDGCSTESSAKVVP